MAGKPGDGDKRSVSTDALETLGKIIHPGEKRDAIHLAVNPIMALAQLKPGQHVEIEPNGAVGVLKKTKKSVGIVDPFLERPVEKGEYFWLVIYPRVISSLRHVWTHPAFEDEPAVADIVDAYANIQTAEPGEVHMTMSDFDTSKRWIEEQAADVNMTFDELMEHAKDHVENGSYVTEYGSDTLRDSFNENFWNHYEVITGAPVASRDRGNFFTCSC